MKALKDCVAKVGAINTKMGLRLDVVTRWNSSFLCLRVHFCTNVLLVVLHLKIEAM